MMSRNDSVSIEFKAIWSSTMYHIDDMPYNPREEFVEKYLKFREVMEKI